MLENTDQYLTLVFVAVLAGVVFLSLWSIIVKTLKKEGKARVRFLKHLGINLGGMIIPGLLFYILADSGVIDVWNSFAWVGLIGVYFLAVLLLAYRYASDRLVVAGEELDARDAYGFGRYSGGFEGRHRSIPAYCFELRDSFVFTDYHASFIGRITKKSIIKTGLEEARPTLFYLVLEFEREEGLAGKASFVFASKARANDAGLKISHSCLNEPETPNREKQPGDGLSLFYLLDLFKLR
jgi:hypothetical protein